MQVLKHVASTCSTVIFRAPRLCDFDVRYWGIDTDLSKIVLIYFFQKMASTQIWCKKVIFFP